MFLFKKKVNLDYESELAKTFGTANKLNKDIKLLVISDTHGDLYYKKDLRRDIMNKEFDLCCILGDIHDYDYDVILENIPKEKIVALLGNHDSFSLLEERGLNDINGKVIECNGIKIAGIQGSFKYKPEEFPSYTHEESIELAKQMQSADMLLSHDKPFTYDNRNMAHDGLKGVTYYLYKNAVPINIHGHIHISYLDTLKNGTQVKGVYECELITIKDGKIVIDQ